MSLPTFQELYDAGADVVTSDPDHTLDDFSAGTYLDAFAGVAAGVAQATSRWVQRQARRFFRRTASGDDLDVIAWDRYRVTRESLGDEDMTDEEFGERIDDYLANGIGRGTLPALKFWLENLVAGVASATVTEDTMTGIITLTVTAEEDATNDDVEDIIADELDAWKPGGHPVNYTVSGGL